MNQSHLGLTIFPRDTLKVTVKAILIQQLLFTVLDFDCKIVLLCEINMLLQLIRYCNFGVL